jgi:hypothetical protein
VGVQALGEAGVYTRDIAHRGLEPTVELATIVHAHDVGAPQRIGQPLGSSEPPALPRGTLVSVVASPG